MLPFGGSNTLGMLLLNFIARYPKTAVPERDLRISHKFSG
jgi:hypothetical protein